MSEEKNPTSFDEVFHTKEPGDRDDMNDVMRISAAIIQEWMKRKQKGTDDVIRKIKEKKRMENDFIELHRSDDGEQFMVNRRTVVKVEPLDEKNTLISLSGLDESWVAVSESYKTVKRMLMGDNDGESDN